MLFQLSKQHYPNARQTTVLPPEYANIALPGHIASVTIDDSCTLIHQTVQKENYSIWVNNFFIHRPLLLQIQPEKQMYSLYYSIENLAKLLILKEIKTIPPRTFSQLSLPPDTHYGIFSAGVYRSLQINADESGRSIIQDQQNATTLLREYYFNDAIEPH